MLEDRHYMRRNPFRTGWWSTTVILIAANVVAFVVQKLLPGSFPKAEGYLALSVAGLSHGYVGSC